MISTVLEQTKNHITKMKKLIFYVLTFTFAWASQAQFAESPSGVWKTNAELHIKSGKLYVFRDADNWGRIYSKHMDSPGGQPLYLNYYGTGSTIVGNGGGGLVVLNNASVGGSLDVKTAKIYMGKSNNVDGSSPGLVLRGNNDDFLYDNSIINQYGFGFHGYQDGTTSFTEPTNSYMSGHFGIDFFTGSSHRMRISRNGEVTIGTAQRQAGYLLGVNGKIKAKEIKVEAGWADYVFEPDYDLKSLHEVNQFIRENKHLPGIPSAAEVAENGVSLGEMNSKLLEKIEELTLHTINQQEIIDELVKQNKQIIQELTLIKQNEH